MYRIPLPSTDSSLQLFPRWSEWPLAWQLALLVCSALPVVLVLGLYRYELRLVRRSVALALLGLRLVVVLLLLLVITLRPVAAGPVTEAMRGRVVIAVDRSASMDIADPQRPARDKLCLARALGLARDLCSDLQLDEWVAQYDASGSPRWVAEGEYPDDTERRRRLAEERRRQHDQVCQRVDALTRSQVEQRVLGADGLRLLAAVGERYRVELLGFDRDAWDASPDRADDLFAPMKPTGSAFTNLASPLARTLEQTGPGQGKVRGVILLSDGRHNTHDTEGPIEQAIRLRNQGVPIFPVALGDPQPPPDVVLASVKAPEVVFKDKDAETPIEAVVKVSGLMDQELVVELHRPGQPPVEKRLRPTRPGSYPVVFPVKLDHEGTQQLRVAVRPIPGEISADNNSRAVHVKVVDDQARVLLIDGEPRWEYHYLATALGRDKQVRLDRVVFNQPRINKVPEDELERTGNPSRSLPAGPDALLAYDCVFFGDVSPEQLPAPDRTRLEKYVAERGGTLVILAGKQHMPLAYHDAGPADDPIRKLLPIEAPREVSSTKGFSLALSAEGRLAPFLLIEDTPEESERRWQDLPPHFWAVVGRAKPAARVLAVPSQALRDGEEREQALIAQQDYGRGQVLFVGLDSTWRWRYKVGDRYHHRFWGQLVRWAAGDKLLEGGNRFVRYGTGKPMYVTGEEVDVIVRLQEDAKLAPDALAHARLLRTADSKEEPAALVPLAARAGNPRMREGRVKDLPPGDYRIEPDIPELANRLRDPGSQARFLVAPPDSPELSELATDRPLLDALAAQSGGRVFTPDEVPQLIRHLTEEAVRRDKPVEHRLWQWWPLLALLMGLLTLEWAGRKWAGLP